MHIALKTELIATGLTGVTATLAACGESKPDTLRAAAAATSSDARMQEAHWMMTASTRTAAEAVTIIRAAANATSSDARMLEALDIGLGSSHAASGVVELMRGASAATSSDARMLELLHMADGAGIDPFTARDAMRRAASATSSDDRMLESVADLFEQHRREGGLATTPVPVG